MGLEIGILGPILARRDGEEVRIGGAQRQAILAALAVRSGEACSADWLIDGLWGDVPPASAKNVLQSQIAKLRRALEPERSRRDGFAVVVSDARGYRLDCPGESIDAACFEAMGESAIRHLGAGDATSASECARAALAWWRGDALGEAAAFPFLEGEARRLDELRVQTRELQIEAEVLDGHAAEAAAEAEALVEQHPHREGLTALLMRAEYADGRQADALATFARLRDRLRDELGVDPSPQLVTLEHDIRTRADGLAPLVAGTESSTSSPRRPLPLALLPPHSTDLSFVGRDLEISALDRCWRDPTGPKIALVAGEPGVGKSRLTAEFARRVHADGAIVLAGRCEGDLDEPFLPFVEALRDLVEITDAADLADSFGPHAGELRRLVPEVAAKVPGLPDPQSSDPETERYRVFEAFVEWLEAISVATPTALVLEDLHWATEPTIRLLEHICGNARLDRLMIVATHRPMAGGSLISGITNALHRAGTVLSIDLGGLAAEPIAEMIAEAGVEVDPQGLAERTGGNPYMAIELLRHGETKVPASVRELTTARIDGLGDGARDVLAAASVLGTTFDPDLVPAVSGCTEQVVLDALDAAEQSGLITTVRERPVLDRFVHALVRDAVYEGLPGPLRQTLHRRAVEVLTRTAEDANISQLAGHCLAAGDDQGAIRWLYAHGTRRLAGLAPSEALDAFETALDLVDRKQEDTRQDLRCDLLIGRAEAQGRTGHPDHWASVLTAAEQARELGDARRCALALLATAAPVGAYADRDSVRDDMFRWAIPRITDERFRIEAMGAFAAFDTRTADDAVDAARRLGDDRLLASVLGNTFYRGIGPEWVERRLKTTEEQQRSADATGDPVLRYEACQQRMIALYRAGRVIEADELLDRGVALAADTGTAWAGAMQRYFQSVRARSRGQIARAIALVGEADDIQESAHFGDAGRHRTFAWTALQIDQGRLAAAVDLILTGDERPPRATVAVYALALAESGRHDEASAVLDDLRAGNFGLDHRGADHAVILTVVAQVASTIGHRDAMVAVRPHLGAGPAELDWGAWFCGGRFGHHLANIDAADGRDGAAATGLAESVAFYERMDMPVWQARALLDSARCASRRGSPTASGSFLDAARRVADRIGLPWIAERADALESEL